MIRSIVTHDYCSSARQPLVQAPAQIKEPSLLRKLTAAGAQSTLSPARRGPGKENASAGPSSGPKQPLERLGEEDEGGEEKDNKGYDAAVRERELATQKARIVSQMAATGVATVSTDHLSPHRTVPTSRSIPRDLAMNDDPIAGKRDIRASLFDIFAQNLVNALAASTTGDGYRPPGKHRSVGGA